MATFNDLDRVTDGKHNGYVTGHVCDWSRCTHEECVVVKWDHLPLTKNVEAGDLTLVE